MTILNSDNLGNYVAITPVKAVFTDSLNSNALVVHLISDNLTSSCVVRYYLYNISIVDSVTNYLLIYNNTVPITGTDYSSWSGDNEYVYSFIGSTLNITIL